jgi:hypothetical protein
MVAVTTGISCKLQTQALDEENHAGLDIEKAL